MKIIIGLGNPGEAYLDTRHNLGFIFLDYLKKQRDFPEFEENKKFQALVSKKQEALLVKPQTFMNLSGKSIQAILNFYKLSPADIIVIQDDLDIQTGKYKIATNSSSAGHNGIENIIENLGTQEFKRVRIGIGQSTQEKLECPLDMHNFVLGKLQKEEKEKIEKLFPEIEKEIR